MLSFFKKWRKKRQLKKLIQEFEERQQHLLNKARALEEFANVKIKELELKVQYLEEQLAVFERVLDSLDPTKRIN